MHAKTELRFFTFSASRTCTITLTTNVIFCDISRESHCLACDRFQPSHTSKSPHQNHFSTAPKCLEVSAIFRK
ncbi:hypothetical protein M3J09_013425 [Ascochyta lentis]